MIPEYDKMLIRKFKRVQVCKVKDLMARFGEKVSNLAPPDDAVFNPQPNRKLETLELLKQEAYKTYAAEQRRIAEENERKKALESNDNSE